MDINLEENSEGELDGESEVDDALSDSDEDEPLVFQSEEDGPMAID